MAVVALASWPLSVSTAALAGPSAPAAAAWTIQSSPNEPGAIGSSLSAVSCVKTGACAAVGTYYVSGGNPDHQYTLALERTGAKWALEPTPALKGVGWSLFNGVSCVSATSCLAVGYTVSSSSNAQVRPLAERWNGTAWALVSPPVPAGADPWAVLDGVSCPATTYCLAVGGYFKDESTGQEQPLAEAWNGASWTQLNAPNPKAENGSELTSDSCVSDRACEVDGDYDYADVAQSVFGYGYNAAAWTSQKQVNPGGQEFNADDSVSCTSASACTSAGYWTSTGPLALGERWNGTGWSRQTLPVPAKSGTDSLGGVSCTTATACTAVGSSSPSVSSTASSTMAMTWNGAKWQLASTPDPTGGGGLNAVSCTGPTACVAVGAGTSTTLVEVSPSGSGSG